MDITKLEMRDAIFRTETTFDILPEAGDVLAWSQPKQAWLKMNVKYVRRLPEIYTRWRFFAPERQ